MGPALKQDPMLRHFDSDLIESKYSDFYDKSLMAFFYDLRSLVSEFKSNFFNNREVLIQRIISEKILHNLSSQLTDLWSTFAKD